MKQQKNRYQFFYLGIECSEYYFNYTVGKEWKDRINKTPYKEFGVFYMNGGKVIDTQFKR